MPLLLFLIQLKNKVSLVFILHLNAVSSACFFSPFVVRHLCSSVLNPGCEVAVGLPELWRWKASVTQMAQEPEAPFHGQVLSLCREWNTFLRPFFQQVPENLHSCLRKHRHSSCLSSKASKSPLSLQNLHFAEQDKVGWSISQAPSGALTHQECRREKWIQIHERYSLMWMNTTLQFKQHLASSGSCFNPQLAFHWYSVAEISFIYGWIHSGLKTGLRFSRGVGDYYNTNFTKEKCCREQNFLF